MSGDWHRVGAGLSVRFTLRASHFEAEWRPRKPTKREFKRILNSYRRARYLFLDELARRNGRNVLCLELPV